LQLKCAHLVSAKALLPEEAIFNRNKAAVEIRRAARKAWHKECQITKRDRKAGERDISSDEDPLLTVNSCIKVRLDLQADKSLVVVKGPFFPRVVDPRYRIRGTNV
jgi:hypothetical protein